MCVYRKAFGGEGTLGRGGGGGGCEPVAASHGVPLQLVRRAGDREREEGEGDRGRDGRPDRDRATERARERTGPDKILSL